MAFGHLYGIRRVASIGTLLVAMSCATEPDLTVIRDASAPFQTSRLDYAFVDETWAWTLAVPVSYTNTGTAPVHLGCHSMLQFREPSSWSLGSGHPCPSIAMVFDSPVAPGATVTFTFTWTLGHERNTIPPTAPPPSGIYRILFSLYERQVQSPDLIVWREVSVDRRRSNEFAVRLRP